MFASITLLTLDLVSLVLMVGLVCISFRTAQRANVAITESIVLQQRLDAALVLAKVSLTMSIGIDELLADVNVELVLDQERLKHMHRLYWFAKTGEHMTEERANG